MLCDLIESSTSGDSGRCGFRGVILLEVWLVYSWGGVVYGPKSCDLIAGWYYRCIG